MCRTMLTQWSQVFWSFAATAGGVMGDHCNVGVTSNTKLVYRQREEKGGRK